MSSRNRSPKAMASIPSETARAQAAAIAVSYCSFEHGHGKGTGQSGRPAASACSSSNSCRKPCMATRPKCVLMVVSRPTISYPGCCNSRCSAQALSLPPLQLRRTRLAIRAVLECRHDFGSAHAAADDLIIVRRQVVGDLEHADRLGLQRGDVRVRGLEVERAITGPQVLILAAAGVAAVVVVHMQLEQAVGDRGERLERKVDAGPGGRTAGRGSSFGEMRVAEVQAESYG